MLGGIFGAYFVLVVLRLLGAGIGHEFGPVDSERDARPPAMAVGPGAVEGITQTTLSLVQGFYVDGDRVRFADLAYDALSALEALPNVSVERQGDQVIVGLPLGRERRLDLGDVSDLSSMTQWIHDVAEIYDSARAAEKVEGLPEGASSPELGILGSMLMALDPHTTLLTPADYRELRQGTEGAFGGVGVLVGMRDALLTVISPIPNSPASRADVQANDVILAINNQETFGVALNSLVENMRGEPGTEVELSLLRAGALTPRQVSLAREVIRVESVQTRVLHQDSLRLLHAKVESFSSRTAQDLHAALRQERRAPGGLQGVILDLRSNPGGLLDQAVAVSDIFLRSGAIVRTQGRREEVEEAGNSYWDNDLPVVVLMNGDSASASEIVAGALQDHDRALVVGQPSFGKGSVQTVFELPEEYALKLTIARYYTPQGHSIQNRGVIPDIWIHPVDAESSENENIFGPYRFRNERFLSHHLRSEDASSDDDDEHRSVFYYLRDPIKSREEGRTLRDVELEVATTLLTTRADRSPGGESRSARALHERAWPVIQEYFRPLHSDVERYLESEMGIVWSTGGRAQTGLPVFSFEAGDRVDVVAGSTASLPWRLKSQDKYHGDRVSIFLSFGGEDDLGMREIAIGRVAPMKGLEGAFRLRVPAGLARERFHGVAGVAVDGVPINSTLQDVYVDVFPAKARPSLAVRSHIMAEVGGHLPSVLEVGERMTMRVELTNEGSSIAEDVTIRAVNLAGAQLHIPTDRTIWRTLAPGRTVTWEFEVRGSERIVSSKLPVGILVDSISLEGVVTARSDLAASPRDPSLGVEARHVAH